MQMMKEGAKWELYIPSELGYGDRGAGGESVVVVVIVRVANKRCWTSFETEGLTTTCTHCLFFCLVQASFPVELSLFSKWVRRHVLSLVSRVVKSLSLSSH